MSIIPVGPLTPYITPDLLVSAPTGISWSTIPPGRAVTPPERTAEQYNIAQRATAIADGYCNQILRATLDTEYLSGPDYYVTYQQGTGNMRLILSRWPVVSVSAIYVSPNVFPRSWTEVTSGYYAPETPTMGVYGSVAPTGTGQGGQSVIMSSGYADWSLGRNGYVFQVQYINGWPHCSLTTAVTAGSTSVAVDDCTGWAAQTLSGASGATGVVNDIGGAQETVQVTASSVPAGPGTLTLASGLVYNHAAGVMVSTLPASVQWACTLLATSQALTRGATATTVHTVPGGSGGSPASKGPESLAEEAELLLHPYKRII
jgi:hypothetical protein